MPTITNTEELRSAILILEQKRDQQAKELKEQFYVTYESFKTINLLKKILVETVTSPGLISGIVKTIMDMTTRGSKSNGKEGASASVFKGIVKDIVKFGVTNFLVKHHDTILLYVQAFLHKLFGKKKTAEPEPE